MATSKERLWKELKVNPKAAFEELFKTLVREDSVSGMLQLENLMENNMAFWASRHHEVMAERKSFKRTAPQWVEAYGVLSKEKSSTAHLINPWMVDPDSAGLCGTDAYSLEYSKELPSGKTLCRRCLGSLVLKDREPGQLGSSNVSALWARVMGLSFEGQFTRHLLTSKGELLCGKERVLELKRICHNCVAKVESLEQFQLEYEKWKATPKQP